MNMREFATLVAKDTGRTIPQATEDIWTVFGTLARILAAGDSLTLTNVGTFEPHERRAHKARNVQTGETIDVPAHTVPRFRPTGKFKKMVRDGDTTVSIRKPSNIRNTPKS